MAGNKLKEDSFYPLSRSSRYLIHLTNLMWRRILATGFERGLYKNDGDMALQELGHFLRKDIKNKEWIKHFAPSLEIKFSAVAIQKQWPYPLLEIKMFLSLYAEDHRSMDTDSKLKLLALLDTLYPDLDPDGFMGLWYKRFKGIPFYLTKNIELFPHYDAKNPEGTLWAWTAMFLTEIKNHNDRLKLCKFVNREKGPCLNLFWDESKNKVAKYCNEACCKRAQRNEKVYKWRSKQS